MKKSLTNTTDFSQIVNLVKVCSESNVTEFEFGDLKVKFATKDNNQVNAIVSNDSIDLDADMGNNVSNDDRELDMEVYEDSLSELQLSDPLAYEEAIRKVKDAEDR